MGLFANNMEYKVVLVSSLVIYCNVFFLARFTYKQLFLFRHHRQLLLFPQLSCSYQISASHGWKYICVNKAPQCSRLYMKRSVMYEIFVILIEASVKVCWYYHTWKEMFNVIIYQFMSFTTRLEYRFEWLDLLLQDGKQQVLHTAGEFGMVSYTCVCLRACVHVCVSVCPQQI